MSDIIEKLQDIISYGHIEGCATTDFDIAAAIDEIRALREWKIKAINNLPIVHGKCTVLVAGKRVSLTYANKVYEGFIDDDGQIKDWVKRVEA